MSKSSKKKRAHAAANVAAVAPAAPASDTAEDVADIATDVHVAVMRLARRLRTERPGGLTPTQMATLATLTRSGPQPISTLAAREGVKPPSMTRTVAALVAAGMAERQPDPNDARISAVAATPAGIFLIDTTRSLRRAWLTEQLAAMSATDLTTLATAAALLREVADR